MKKAKITEQSLKQLSIVDISIRQEHGVDFLILILNNETNAVQLHQLLKDHFGGLTVFIDEKTGNYNLNIDLKDSEFSFFFKSDRNEIDYPPIVKLKDGSVDSMTTGIWGEMTNHGKMVYFNPDLIRLGNLDIANCFSRSNSVQFHSLTDQNSDPTVILLFSDWDHVLFAEADKAYETLRPMSVLTPKLEIKCQSDNKVSLRIWDIAVDLDIQMVGLSYDEKELKSFLENTGEKESFLFALGFPPKDGIEVAIASTKSGGPDLIKIHGYVVK